MALRSLNPGDRSNRTRYRPMAEINVTPFVDVMLILLVVFMVSAPLLTVGVPLDLPKGEAPALNEPDDPITLSIQPDGSLFLNDQPTTAQSILIELEALPRATGRRGSSCAVTARCSTAMSWASWPTSPPMVTPACDW